MQWAAVRTRSGAISVPVQEPRLATNGTVVTSTDVPPETASAGAAIVNPAAATIARRDGEARITSTLRRFRRSAIGDRPWSFFMSAERKGWDSNPRRTCALSGFQDRCDRPLCHPSEQRLRVRPRFWEIRPDCRPAVCLGDRPMALNLFGGAGRRRNVGRLRSGGDVAVDLGTANTVVYVRGRGIVLSEPSVVAIDQRTGEVHAVGADAQRMIGRTPATISADRPLRHGVIADFEVTEAMLRQFVGKVLNNRFARPRMVICAPSGITEVERRAVEEATLSAGAREVHLIEESLAAAIGAGVDIAEPK